MKIAFVTPQLIVGGAETYIARKSRWLIEHGHEVLVISEGGCFVEMLPPKVEHIVLGNISKPPYHLSFQECRILLDKMTSILLSAKVDVIEAHNTFPILYLIMSSKKHKIPFCLNVLLDLSYDHNWLLCNATTVLDRVGLYYTLTENMNKHISGKCRIRLTPKIIPIPIEITKRHLLQEGDYILTVGRLSPDKMYLKYLIVAFKELIQRHDFNVQLFVVGDGGLKPEIESIAKDANQALGRNAVVLLGTVVGEALDKLYANCTAYVGVGTTLLMSAANAKPTIIASGLDECQPYAYGLWGLRPDEDKAVIGGTVQMENRKQPYQDILLHILTTSKEKRAEYGKAAYTLLNDTCELNTVMDKWQKEYTYIAGTPLPIKLYKYATKLSVYTKILHICYLVYKSLNLKKIRR